MTGTPSLRALSRLEPPPLPARRKDVDLEMAPVAFPPWGGDKLFKVVPRMAERSRNDEGFSGQGSRRDFQKVGPVGLGLGIDAQSVQDVHGVIPCCGGEKALEGFGRRHAYFGAIADLAVFLRR